MTGAGVQRALSLDPHPEDSLTSLYLSHPRVADVIEDALDWIEADPPDSRGKRRRFSNGMWAITVHAVGQEWLVIWEEPTANHPVVRHIGEATSL